MLLSLVLGYATVAGAAVIRNNATTTTEPPSSTTSASSVTPPPANGLVAAAVASSTEPGTWTYNFAQFISLDPSLSPPTQTPRPTTPLSHLYPEMYPFYALSRVPEKPWIGLASPYGNSFQVQHGHTDSDMALRASCSSSFDASLDPWLMTAPIGISTVYPVSSAVWTPGGFTGVRVGAWSTLPTTVTSGTFTFKVYSAIPTTVTQPPVEVTDVYDSWTLWTYKTPFTYSASGGCCWTCTIVGGTHVQVNYWPKTTTGAPVSTIVDSKGFTFTSPSVYIAFETLYATNLCGKTGPAYGATTIGFGPTELSTQRAVRWDFSAYATAPPVYYQTLWTQADWGDQSSCANTERSFYQYRTYATFDNLEDLSSSFLSYTTTTLESTDIHHYTITWNNCSPSLSVPTEILDLNTDWKDCSQGFSGLYDPPYALTSQGALVPTSTAPPVTSTPPSQSQIPDPPTPSPTPPAEPVQTPTPTPDPPVQSPPTNPSSSKPQDPVQTPPVDPGNTPTPPSDPGNTPKPPQDPGNTPTPPSDPGNTPKPPQDPGNTPTPPSDPPANTPQPPQDPGNTPKPQDPQNPGQGKPTTSAGVITIGSSTIVAGPSSDFVIGTQTLAPGSQIVESGTTIALATDGASIIVGGSTLAITSAPITRPSGFVVGSQTLAAGGPAVTISGVEVSLGSDAATVVVGGSSMPLSQYLGSSTTIATNLGSVIASFGGFGKPTTTYAQAGPTTGYNGTMFTGGASSPRHGAADVWIMGALAAAGMAVVGAL